MKNPKKTCVKQWHYETYITKDLVGDVDAHYHTNPTGAARGIAGMSMGGLGAWALALRHPDEFAAAASHSGYLGTLYQGPHPYVAGKVQLIPASSPADGQRADRLRRRRVRHATTRSGKRAIRSCSSRRSSPASPRSISTAAPRTSSTSRTSPPYIHDTLTARHIEHAYFIGPGHHNFEFWIRARSRV